MKRTLFITAVAAMAVMASCQKEELISGEEELVFTATIVDSQTRTTINTNAGDTENRGYIYWVEGDEITITDAASNSAVYVAQSDGQTAKFKKKSGESDLGAGPYTATYGTVPSTSQNYGDYYSAANVAKNIYMTAPSTESKYLTFAAACGLLRLNLTADSGEGTKNISEIQIMGKISGTTKIYTLNCSTAQSISTSKEFYIALPAGSYDVMKFTNSGSHVCYKTIQTAMSIVANTIQPVTITGIEFNDLLPGVFSVSGTEKVRFTRGNLKWTGSKWVLYENQYGCDKAVTKDLFWWTSYLDYNEGSAALKPYTSTYKYGTRKTTNAFFCGEGHPLTINGYGSLYALSEDEWTYLLNTRTTPTTKYLRNGTAIKVNDVPGVILVPDNIPASYTFNTTKKTYSITEWAKAQNAGLVFLPITGRLNKDDDGTLIAGLPNTYFSYWTSSNTNDSEINGRSLDEVNGSTSSLFIDTSYRNSARPIRLVKKTN